jgi:polar amino acid transport system permease protein
MTSDADVIEAPAPIKAVPVRHPGRWVMVLVVLVLLAMLVDSVFKNPGYRWSIQRHYIFSGPVISGVLKTLELTVAAMLIGVLGGIAVAVARLSPNPVLSAVSWVYIWGFRGTPVLVQVFIWYTLAYLFPHLSLGIPFGPTIVTGSTNKLIAATTAAILGLGLNEAAYMAEIVRAGILSVDEGQTEAASALGMSRGLVMRRIVLPQAMRVIVPPTGNETISMLKTTSIAAFITVQELFQAGQNISSRTYITVPILLMVSAWYLVMTSVLTIGQYYIERYYGRGSSRGGQALTLAQRLRQTLTSRRPPPADPIIGLGMPHR